MSVEGGGRNSGAGGHHFRKVELVSLRNEQGNEDFERSHSLPAVTAAIVHEDDATGPELAVHRIKNCPLPRAAPVASIDGPGQVLKPPAGRQKTHARAPVPARGAVIENGRAGRRLVNGVEVAEDLPPYGGVGPERQPLVVRHRVIAQAVAASNNLAHQIRVPVHLVANHAERGAYVVLAQDRQYLRRVNRAWAVVACEGDPLTARVVGVLDHGRQALVSQNAGGLPAAGDEVREEGTHRQRGQHGKRAQALLKRSHDRSPYEWYCGSRAAIHGSGLQSRSPPGSGR